MSTTETPEKRSRLWLVMLPVLVFAGLAALFWKGLSGTPNENPSAIINKPVPDFVQNPVPGLDAPGF
jgi:cytochrome c biogenesis protein CcmG/thiol:disulfide interchange protein DsbE